MTTLINTIALWEAGQRDQAVLDWIDLPKTERAAVLADTETKTRFTPLAVAAVAYYWVKRCTKVLAKFEDGGIEPDEITNVGVAAQGRAEGIRRMGFPEEAERIEAACLLLLKAAVMD